MASHALKPEMTDEQLQHHAFAVLARELGPGNYARFLRLFCAGRGDYTAERHQWLAGVTIEDIARELGISPDPKEEPSSTTPPR